MQDDCDVDLQKASRKFHHFGFAIWLIQPAKAPAKGFEIIRKCRTSMAAADNWIVALYWLGILAAGLRASRGVMALVERYRSGNNDLGRYSARFFSY